jgi:hypothetical protein
MLPTEVLLLVTDALESLNIMYCVGGSFASSTYGEPRATRDVDILVDFPSNKVALFVKQIGSDFFVQASDIYDAINIASSRSEDPLHRATCNLVHRNSFFRVDLFVSSGRAYDSAQISRRIAQTVALNPERHAYFVSPEDIILIKLEWYRLSQGVLDRQWHDMLSVLATQADTLDLSYLQHWAGYLAPKTFFRGRPTAIAF